MYLSSKFDELNFSEVLVFVELYNRYSLPKYYRWREIRSFEKLSFLQTQKSAWLPRQCRRRKQDYIQLEFSGFFFFFTEILESVLIIETIVCITFFPSSCMICLLYVVIFVHYELYPEM